MTFIVFFCSCLLSGAVTFSMVRLAPRLGFLDSPCERSSHHVPTPRAGGIGLMFATASIAFYLDVPNLIWLPAIFVSLISLYDDRRGVPPLIRFFFHVLAAAAALPAFLPDDFGTVQVIALGLIWIVFLVASANFVNFMDGINGMAGLSGAVGFALLACFAYLHNGSQWQLILPIGMAAACLGFLPFNFPRAQIFLGDVGSILIGFAFASLVATLAIDLWSFFVLAGCLLPIYADATFTLFCRWRSRENLLAPHRQHLYQLLIHHFRFSHWQVSSSYALLQLITGLVLILGQQWWGNGFVIAILFTSVTTFAAFAVPVRRGALVGSSDTVPVAVILEGKN